jgi:hypothetical protein
VDAKRLLREGADTGLSVKAAQHPDAATAPETFGAVAMEWFERKKSGKKEIYTSRILGSVEKSLLPIPDDRPIVDIKTPELLEALRKIESRGTVETAHRCLQY